MLSFLLASYSTATFAVESLSIIWHYCKMALKLEYECLVEQVSFTHHSFTAHLNDGRTISVPITWYPRLLSSTMEELENYELNGDGEGIHWPDLDEDISVEGIIAGRRSGESQKSLDKWLKKRSNQDVSPDSR